MAAPKERRVVGEDFRGKRSCYRHASESSGVVGLLAYDVCAGLSEEEYDKWLFDVHYHDLMANPHLNGITLRTVSKEHKAVLSSGASVKNEVEFYRLAELNFDSFEAYDKYVQWFQDNAIPPPRTPAGKSAFKFYLLSQAESISRSPPDPEEPQKMVGPDQETTVLVIGSTGNIGSALVKQLGELKNVKVLEASRSEGGTVQLDIYDEASVAALDAGLPGGVDHVVVCCGASIFGPLSGFTGAKWAQSCGNKFVAVSRFIVMLANGEEVKCLRPSGSITVTTGQASRIVNKMWPGIAANNAGLEAMVRNAGIEPPRGVRINAVSPGLVTETAAKSGLPTEGTVPAEEVAKAYIPLIFGTTSGVVQDAGAQVAFKKSHHSGQKDGVGAP